MARERFPIPFSSPSHGKDDSPHAASIPARSLLVAERRRDRAPRRTLQRARIHSRRYLHRYSNSYPFVLNLSFARFNYNPSLSTDYVFDGTSPPYVPSAEPNPLNVYAITKRDAELAVLGVEGAHVVVLRVPVLCALLGRPSW
jgi:hypothetical protein